MWKAQQQQQQKSLQMTHQKRSTDWPMDDVQQRCIWTDPAATDQKENIMISILGFRAQ